jgi:hypothetical protein
MCRAQTDDLTSRGCATVNISDALMPQIDRPMPLGPPVVVVLGYRN